MVPHLPLAKHTDQKSTGCAFLMSFRDNLMSFRDILMSFRDILVSFCARREFGLTSHRHKYFDCVKSRGRPRIDAILSPARYVIVPMNAECQHWFWACTMLSRGYLFAFALASAGCAWTPKPYADDPHFRAGQTTRGHANAPFATGSDVRPEPAPPPEDYRPEIVRQD